MELHEISTDLPAGYARKAVRSSAWLRSDGMTYDAVAVELGISRARVQQLEASALKKLFAWCRKHGYCLDDVSRG